MSAVEARLNGLMRWWRRVVRRSPSGGWSGGTAAMKTVFAHSLDKRPTSQWQSLPDHALSVARLAKSHAEKFGAGDLAEIAGLRHDIGKHSDEFQRKLNGAEDVHIRGSA